MTSRSDPRPASDLKGILSKDDLALLIEESCGFWWWFWQKPTLCHPRLWRVAALLSHLKNLASGLGYLQELRSMSGAENYLVRVQEVVLRAPRPVTVSMFMMMLVWAGEQCVADSREETRRRCEQAARVVHAVIKY